MATRLTYEEVKGFVEIDSLSGCKLLSDDYINNQSELSIQCKCKRIFTTTYNRFKSGNKRHCDVCGGGRIDRQYVVGYINSNSNSKFIEGDCTSSTSQLTLICNCGNKFKTSFNQFSQQKKRQCKTCGDARGVKIRSLSFEDVRDFIQGENGHGCTLISDSYIRNNKKLKIKCVCGNEFSTTFQSFVDASKRQCDSCGREILSKRLRIGNKTIKRKVEIDFSDWMDLRLESDDVVDTAEYVTVRDRDGYRYWTTFGNLQERYKNRGVLQKFNPFNKYSLENIALWISLNAPNCKLGDNNRYQNSQSKLHFICEHGKDMFMSWGNFRSGKRCRCVSWAVRKSPEEFIEDVRKLVGDEYSVLTAYTRTIDPINIKHNACGHEYSVKPCDFMRGTRCPLCSISKGESEVMSMLDYKHIKYEMEYSVKGLVGLGGQPLRFDFAIFNEDSPTVTCFIEYDGEFHYHKFFEEQNFDGLKDHDERKNQYCEENNIPLLRIPYWEFDNIEEVLEEWFEQIKETNVIWQN